MKTKRVVSWPRAALFAFGLLATAAVGCQSTVGGQTLPSPNYLRDDVQYFPPGSETRLPNLRRALEQYRLNQQNIGDGLGAPPAP